MTKGLFWALVLFCFTASADPTFFSLNQVPPLHQVIVLQSEADPQHYVILGKDGPYQDAGNWYVVDWRHGQMTSPKLKQESFVWFDGGFDFYYESGEWLFVPSETPFPGALTERIPAGIIRPGQGREPFRRIKIEDSALLRRLHIENLIAPSEVARIDTPRTQTEIMSALPEPVVLLAIDYERSNKRMQTKLQNMEEELSRADHMAILVNNLRTREGGTIAIWAFESRLPEIKERLAHYRIANYSIRSHLLENRQIQAPFVTNGDLYAMPVFRHLDEISVTLDFLDGKLTFLQATPPTADEQVILLADYLHFMSQVVNSLAQVEAAVANMDDSHKARQSFVNQFLRPFWGLVNQVYTRLHAIGTPTAHRTILFASESLFLHPSILDWKADGETTYFQLWLKLLRANMEWSLSASDEELRQARRPNHSGGLEEFGFLRVERYNYLPKEQTQPYGLDEPRFHPLLIFGFKDSEAYRQQLVQFIIEMDKVAEAQRERFASADEKIYGNLTLIRLIQSLSYNAEAMRFSTSPDRFDFNSARYYRQVISVVTELLNTSRFTIKNSATYLSLLDAAIGLQRKVESEFGVVPNERRRDAEAHGLTRELIELQRALQVRLLRSVVVGNTDNCQQLLAAK